MQYTKLGKSSLNVSRVCLGCMGFGDAAHGQHSWTLDEEDSRAIIRRALELGINFFDTAIVYQNGTSEQYLGRALRDFARREDVVVATKFPVRTQEEIDAGISGQEHVRRMLDKSLQNLGMDYVDLYIYHMWDYRTPLYEIMEGLNNAVKAGKTRYIGISNCFAWQLCKANELARPGGLCSLYLRAGTLQPDLPGRGTGDDSLLPGGGHRRYALQRAGWRPPVKAARGRPPGVWRRMPTPRASMMPPRRRIPASLSAWRSCPGAMASA